MASWPSRKPANKVDEHLQEVSIREFDALNRDLSWAARPLGADLALATLL